MTNKNNILIISIIIGNLVIKIITPRDIKYPKHAIFFIFKLQLFLSKKNFKQFTYCKNINYICCNINKFIK